MLPNPVAVQEGSRHFSMDRHGSLAYRGTPTRQDLACGRVEVRSFLFFSPVSGLEGTGNVPRSRCPCQRGILLIASQSQPHARASTFLEEGNRMKRTAPLLRIFLIVLVSAMAVVPV